jgi:glyoxalase family protein
MKSIMQTSLITGLHHVTAMASDPQKNLDFYAGILGLRMVKKTINFDAPDIYHLYYGDTVGNPGTIMTFFPIPGLMAGRKGRGQLTVTSFSIPYHSLDYWMKRLDAFQIPYQHPQSRFQDEVFLYLEDYDGLGIELVANKADRRAGFSYGQIPPEHAIKGFYGVTLSEDRFEQTAALLTEHMGHRLLAESGNRMRFSASGNSGDFVDILWNTDTIRGLNGNGTVHHLAFATPNDKSQLEVREAIAGTGFNPTPVLDRQYFHSIYFREPGGVLFEVATSDIGFTLDEPEANLGESLKLPPWQEEQRAGIEQALIPISLDVTRFMDRS